ncbi:hypothetical protein HPB50_025429 [Hyalomma asiaticum]|uniref:Uncharacterized protein n=1 Tax=Hyalomma asiaticum TaxID=266040 RepID=A0ACB7SL98_HYAAI|nr:hypothetical protein HPB50_025429 [Hyalomma asiaticum]
MRFQRSKDVTLSFASYESTQAEDQRSPIIILHGLFGSKNNWKSLSKAMVNAMKRKVFALDARNHGESPHTEEMDYILMANDVDLFCKERALEKVAIIGHSMGGRTAMTFALTRPSMVERLVVVDVSPVTMPSIVVHDNVLVNHINSMDTVLPQLSPDMSSPAARKEADRILADDIPEVAVRQFLLANLQRGERLYEWQFNLKALKQNLPNIIQMPDLKGLTYDGNTLFVCGGDSPYVSKRDHDAIKEKFPKANIVYIKGAGHWHRLVRQMHHVALPARLIKQSEPTGAVRLAYTLHESADAASATALPPIVAVDGLFGRKENLTTACKALAAATGRNVYAVDLRNHGDSPHTEDVTYALTNADLELFLQDRGVSRAAFMGHSMAGRVVMKFAVTKPSAVERLVIVDVAARTLPPALLTQWLPWQLNAMEHILSLLSPDMSLDHALQVADQYLSGQLKVSYRLTWQ